MELLRKPDQNGASVGIHMAWTVDLCPRVASSLRAIPWIGACVGMVCSRRLQVGAIRRAGRALARGCAAAPVCAILHRMVMIRCRARGLWREELIRGGLSGVW